jgi:hypothetical protein
MAKTILKDVTISVNGVAIADHASAVSGDTSAEEVDVTCFGTAGWREFMQGLKDGQFTVTFFQDFAAGSVHATLQPLFASGSSFPLAIKPTSAAISATNPEIQMTARLFSYSPVSGSVGEASTTEATFRNADPSGVVYDTTP